VSSVVATLCSAMVIIPDPEIFRYIDLLGAIVVLCVIVFTMVQMMRSSILTLLDAPIEEREKLLVFRQLAERFDLWSSISFVRTRRLGYSKYVEIGLVFDETTAMPAALETCRAIEDAIRASLEHAFVAVYPVAERPAELAPA
jgi:divalent metal cation (Fe/Co/Zn/Cd) transporter